MLTVPCLVLDLIIPRCQSISGHVVQASRIRHLSELTEKAWESAVPGLGKTRSMQMPGLLHSNFTVMFSEMSNVLFVCVCVYGGSQTRFCLFVCFLDSTKSNPIVCQRFPLFLFHLFRSFILPLLLKTHSHFTMNFQYLNDFRL